MENQLIVFENNKPIISSEFKKNYKKFINLNHKLNRFKYKQKVICVIL